MSKEDEIINFLRAEVNEKNKRVIISEILKRLEKSGEKVTERILDLGDGKTRVIHGKIGATKFGSWGIGGMLSSDKEYISSNILINVKGGMFGDIVDTTMGDCYEAYEMLIEKLKKIEKPSFEAVMKAVYETTADYFGGVETVDPAEREAYYAELGDKEEIGKVSDLKGKNLAACVERAALSQNLLKFLGFEAIIKQSQIDNDNKHELHAYNLVAYNGKYYIFDATIPRCEEKGEVTPIITEIPKEVFDTLSHPQNGDDVSVKTEYDSVRGHRKIHYNSWSKKVYDATTKAKEAPDDHDIE